MIRRFPVYSRKKMLLA
uniref:Uncharacterized protein n=1 Tax=Arundo donax TaxID=35708 RepID=A0A0A9B636_ARUDO